MFDYFYLPKFESCVLSSSFSYERRIHILLHRSVNIKRASMSSLDQDQRLHPSCRDRTTVSRDSSDTPELAKQPLQGLKLASHAVLEKAQERGRLKCSKCGGSRMFFCYTCCSLLGVSQQEVPLIKVSERSGLLIVLFGKAFSYSVEFL